VHRAIEDRRLGALDVADDLAVDDRVLVRVLGRVRASEASCGLTASSEFLPKYMAVPRPGVWLRPFAADRTVNADSTASMPHYRILVVDDSKLVHELVRMALEGQAGWEIRCAASGTEAIELANAERPDAILLDVEMPELDGPATLAALRAQPITAQTPVVFLTAHDDPDELARLRELGAAGVLAKPFDVNALADELAELLGWPR
jgi:CheY-like chemotaxis protein